MNPIHEAWVLVRQAQVFAMRIDRMMCDRRYGQSHRDRCTYLSVLAHGRLRRREIAYMRLMDTLRRANRL